MTSPPLVCVGNLTVDDLELPNGSRRPACVGGDALYAVLAARAFLPAAVMLAPVGTGLPDAAWDRINRLGLAEELPRRSVPTLHNTVRYHANGSRTWTLHNDPADFDELSVWPADIPAAWSSAEAFLITAMSLNAQSALTRWLRRRTGAQVYLDLQEDYLETGLARVITMIAQAHVFLPSAHEAAIIADTDEWGRACRELAAIGPSLVVIKLGDRGALVYDAVTTTELQVPALAGVDVVDATGAGDAFCGAFAAVHTAGGHPVDAAAAGCAAAAAAISGYGIEHLAESNPADIAENARQARAMIDA